MARANLSLAWFLQVWERSGSVRATHHLAHLVCFLFNEESGTVCITNFWEGHLGQVAQLRIWLERRETLTRLENGLRIAIEQDDEELVDLYQLANAAMRVVLGESLR